MPRPSRSPVPLATLALTVLFAGLPASAEDGATDDVVVGDVVAQSAIIKKPKRPIIDKPIDDEEEEDDDKAEAPKEGDKPSRTVPGVTPKPTPTPKKPELRDGVTAPKRPIDEGTGVKKPIVRQPRQPRDIGKTPRVDDDAPVTRRPRTPTNPDEPRRTVRRPRTNPQPAPDQPPPSNGGGGGGGGGGDGGCCCCSPKVTGMAVGGGILGGVTGLVVGGVVGAGVGYVVAPSGAPPEPVSETDRQIAMGVGALIGGVSGLLLGGVAGVGAGAALGGMLSE